MSAAWNPAQYGCALERPSPRKGRILREVSTGLAAAAVVAGITVGVWNLSAITTAKAPQPAKALASWKGQP